MSTIPPPPPLADVRALVETIAAAHCPEALPHADQLARIACFHADLLARGIGPARWRASARALTDTAPTETALSHLRALVRALEEMPLPVQEELHAALNGDNLCFHLSRTSPPPGSLSHSLSELDTALVQVRESQKAHSPTLNRPPAPHSLLIREAWGRLRAYGVMKKPASLFLAELLNRLNIDRRDTERLSEAIRQMLITQEENLSPLV